MAVIALLSITNIQAQSKKSEWQEKVMSEKIAFITTELELTPEEAQVFWPVYNQVTKENNESHKAMMAAYRAMTKAIEEGTASDKEIGQLLDEYLAAKQKNNNAGNDDVEKYRKVLPAKKVARLYIAEENFRRHHIRNFKSGHKGLGVGNGSGRPVQGGGKPGARK